MERTARKENASTAAAAPKPTREELDRVVNEEHVICTNCYAQFSFLYEGKQDVPPDRPHQVMHAPPEETAKKRFRRYRKLDEAVHPCPSCQYVQPWMVFIGRRLRIRTIVAVAAALFALDYLACAYLARFTDIAMGGFGVAIPLGVLIVMAAGAAIYHSLRVWDPNSAVDQQSFGGAARVVDLKSPPKWDPKVGFSLIPVPHKRFRWVRRALRIAAIGSLAAGGAVFSLPLVSEGMAYHLERMNAAMVPFWVGIVLMTSGSGILVGLGVEGRVHLRRQPRDPAPRGAAGRAEQSG